jgi:hypothetical protein
MKTTEKQWALTEGGRREKDKIDMNEFEEEEYGKDWMRRSSRKWWRKGRQRWDKKKK